MVRLLTHNLLACHSKSCVGAPAAFPLQFKDASIVLREAEYNPDFLRGFMSRLEWGALVSAAKQLGDTSLPEMQPEEVDDDLLQKLHHVLLVINVEEGAMICQNCNHIYAISNGIPNMLLHENEIQ